MEFIIIIISTLSLFFPLTNLLVTPLSSFKKVIIYITIVLIDFTAIPKLGQLTTFITIGCALLIISLFAKPTFLNLSAALFGYLYAVTFNHLTIIFSDLILHIGEDQIQSRYLLPFSALFSILLYITTYYIGKFIRSKIDLHNLCIPDSAFLLLFTEELFCAGYFILNFSYNEKMKYPSYIVITNAVLFSCFFLLTVVISLVIIHYIKKDYASKQKLKEYEQLQNYILELETLYSEMRIYRHDNINLLSSIYGYIDENDMAGLKDYYENEILGEINKTVFSHIEIGKLSEIKILELKGLLYAKLLHAFSKHLTVSISIDSPITSTSMENIDLVKILGIFLDNAIEAAESSIARQLDISFSKTSDSTVLSIGNSCDLETIPLIRISDIGYSTKGSARGIGLSTAKQLLLKYPDVFHHTQFRDHYFTQRLENI